MSILSSFSRYPEVVWAALIILITAIILISARKILICFLKTRAIYIPDDILKMDRPFYIHRNRWNIILEKANTHKAEQDEFPIFINYFKPYYFSDRKIEY